jgi:hypothetical protein
VVDNNLQRIMERKVDKQELAMVIDSKMDHFQ